MDWRLLAEPRLQLVQRITSGMPRPSALVAALATFCLATAAHAAPTPRPVVVELFTSQACSDCPPADALLQQLQASDPRILALDLHVTYFTVMGLAGATRSHPKRQPIASTGTPRSTAATRYTRRRLSLTARR